MKHEKSIKQVSTKRKIKNYYKRWNISVNNNESYISFKNRIINILKEEFGPKLIYGEFISEYLNLVGERRDSIVLVKSSFPSLDIGDKEYDLSINSPIYSIIDKCNDSQKLILYLQGFFWCKKIDNSIKRRLYQEMKKAIDISFLPIKVVFKNGEYDFYPAGAKLLDKKLVNEVLDWLEDYPEVYKHFNLSLKQYMKKEYSRNILDNLRFSLEQLLKSLFNNQKSLEKQKDNILRFLNNKNINQEIINVYNTIISQYTKYQNENVKHNEKLYEGEIEFMIYLTGNIMRFLLTISKEEEK